MKRRRTQRRSDGTFTIDGVRFEIPSRFRHFPKIMVRFQRWDLSMAYIVDEHTADEVLACVFPLDKRKNAEGMRRALEPISQVDAEHGKTSEADPIPPLMRKLLAQYAATGLPPAYLPKDEQEEADDE